MSQTNAAHWAFLTNHCQVLVCIARDPGARLRDIGEHLGITERAAHRIVAELAGAGYVSRERVGRRNRYSINADLPLPDAVAGERSVGDLLEMLAGTADSEVRGVAGSST
ncbi:MAG: helix-turn-helix transcriptional regulator [Solirubrobacteraceae bacterium]